jgi:hypothetical protein
MSVDDLSPTGAGGECPVLRNPFMGVLPDVTSLLVAEVRCAVDRRLQRSPNSYNIHLEPLEYSHKVKTGGHAACPCLSLKRVIP